MSGKLCVVMSLLIVGSLLFSQQMPFVAGPLNPEQDAESLASEYAFSEAYWKTVAQNAWRYFQPDVAVHSDNGLHNAHLNYHGFTDWDLASYVLAAVDMGRLGLLSNEGEWGFDDRINKILLFLEDRPLTGGGVPYVWYSSDDGQNIGGGAQYAVDAAFLLIALKNVAEYRQTFAARINTIVNVRTTYEPLKQAVEGLTNPGRPLSIYDYFTAAGFAEFWPSRFASKANTILSNIMNAPTVTYEGVALPQAKITCEPLMLSIFGLGPNADITSLAEQVYLAHEARYEATGKYVAFSEGNPEGIVQSYVWEWVVTADGRTWVTQRDETTDITMTPAVFIKTALGLASLYSTPFTQSMVNWLEPDMLRIKVGYYEGKSESGQTMPIFSDKTNGMIINAARYAVENLQATPTPTPSSSPAVSSSPTSSPTSSTTPGSTSTPSTTSTLSPSPSSGTPSNSPSPSPSVTPATSPSASSSPASSPTQSPSTSASVVPTQTPGASPSASASASESVVPSSTVSQSPEFGLLWYSDPLLIALIVVVMTLVAVVLFLRFRHK